MGLYQLINPKESQEVAIEVAVKDKIKMLSFRLRVMFSKLIKQTNRFSNSIHITINRIKYNNGIQFNKDRDLMLNYMIIPFKLIPFNKGKNWPVTFTKKRKNRILIKINDKTLNQEIDLAKA